MWKLLLIILPVLSPKGDITGISPDYGFSNPTFSFYSSFDSRGNSVLGTDVTFQDVFHGMDLMIGTLRYNHSNLSTSMGFVGFNYRKTYFNGLFNIRVSVVKSFDLNNNDRLNPLLGR